LADSPVEESLEMKTESHNPRSAADAGLALCLHIRGPLVSRR
jgi:hypothetical protein